MKTLKLKEETHTNLLIFKAENNLKTLDKTVEKLLEIAKHERFRKSSSRQKEST